MRHMVIRIAAAGAALMLGGLGGGATISAAPNLVPRHQASSKVAPDPGYVTGAPAASGCGAGRFAVNCGAPTLVQPPMAARRAMESDARAEVLAGTPALVPVPSAARRALESEARAEALTGVPDGAGWSSVVPHGARAALEAEPGQ